MTKFKKDCIKSILFISVCYAADRSFALGVRIGIGIIFFNALAKNLMKIPPQNDQSYSHSLISKPASVMLWGPIYEEVRYRLIMLRILKYSSGLALPSIASEPISNIHLSCVDIFAIIGSAAEFGLAHFANSEAQDNYEQVIVCAISGLVYGVLSLYFEPQVTIAVHIANNSLVMCFIFLSTLLMEPMLSRLEERLLLLDKESNKAEGIFIEQQIKALNDIKCFFDDDDCLLNTGDKTLAVSETTKLDSDKLTDKGMTFFALESESDQPVKKAMDSTKKSY